MTIRELETCCGIDRATIRFYEQEGLLAPQRRANGYRDYSEEDALALEKIALLRRLGLSIESIRTVQRGELPLGVVLEQQDETLLTRQEDTFRALQISRAIRQEGASYNTLQPAKYKAQLPPPTWTPRVIPPAAPQKHYATRHPWRRLFARELDMGLYLLPWGFFMAWQGWTFWQLLLFGVLGSALSFLLLESLLLCTVGTTPGKWLMGLRLRRHYIDQVSKPTFRDAFFRTLHLYFAGCGLGILPGICYLFAFLRANRGDDQPWDELWEYTAEEEVGTARFVVVFAALLAVHFAQNKELELLESRLGAAQEARREELQEAREPTVRQLVDSVNRVLAEHRDFADFRHVSLNDDGTWNNWEEDISAFDLTITEENGKLATAVAEAVYPGAMAGARPDGVELYSALMLGLHQARGYDVTGMSATFAAESFRDMGSWADGWGSSYDLEPDEDDLEQYFILTQDGFFPRAHRETPDLRITISVGKIENPYADWMGSWTE